MIRTHRVLVVGELNPYGADPRFALYHLPRGASGDRLREHLGLRDVTYEALGKINLCAGKWSTPAAREVAGRIIGLPAATAPEVVVMLGAKVKAAFGVPKMEAFSAQGILVALPHPSGLNRHWHSVKDARRRARELLARVAPWVPWGEVE